MKEVLKKGMHMCIYPEGTRNRTNEPLKKFYDGAFKLAVETKQPLSLLLSLIPRKHCLLINHFILFPINWKCIFLNHSC